ncbi:AMP-binding protein [Flavobacteriaceae bacterium S356]|uniref:AMP-binding protein n=1 Tax=Asprobacillus argus TaxID=3076534 RepID=A0ABU3LIN1_9FLAO|nr:AMP-binding protein [Flavobacteriaceae bacterium S356]
MKNWECHKDFRLNGASFQTEETLLAYADVLSKPVAEFLQEWFSESETISIKTSGSTGKPKWIKLQKEHMINSARVTGDFFELGAGIKALLCLPIDYIAGKMMLVRAMYLGWHLDVVPSSSKPLAGLDREYDFSAMIPLQLKNSLEAIGAVKKLIVGGGAVDHKLENELQSISTSIYATYGMTETCTHVAIKKLNHSKWDSFKALKDVVISKDSRGCLIIDAPSVSNEQIITNDVVEIISDDTFDWKGRYDNVINSGGIKLHPEEIEKKIAPYLNDRFFVAGIKDQALGEKLVLVVEGEASKTSESIYRDLTKYEIPKNIFFIKKFEETETQKIQRKKTLHKINA